MSESNNMKILRKQFAAEIASGPITIYDDEASVKDAFAESICIINATPDSEYFRDLLDKNPSNLEYRMVFDMNYDDTTKRSK